MAQTCPFCKAPLADGARFCGSCGNRLPMEESIPAAHRESAHSGADGKPFTIRMAHPAAFRAGRRSPLAVWFKATEDVFTRVEFRLLCADREVASNSSGDRPGVSERKVLLQVTPQNPGGAALELQTLLTADGMDEPEVYVTRFVINVDDAAARNSVLNVAPHFSSDRAGHNEIGSFNVNIARGAFGADDADDSRYDALLGPELNSAELKRSPRRLTLRADDGRTVQLLPDEEITFGRNDANLVVARIYGPDGRRDEAANKGNLSRFHFKIVHSCGKAYVVDANSTNGTSMNGAGVDSSGGVRLGDGAVIAAGRRDAELKYGVRLQSGGWSGVSGMVLERGDGAPETVIAVWSGRVGFEGGAFTHDGGCWTFSDAVGRTEDLGLFSRVRIGDTVMRVMPYHHVFL